jgi:hypothetical protein
MMKVLVIVLLIVFIAGVAWLVARARHGSGPGLVTAEGSAVEAGAEADLLPEGLASEPFSEPEPVVQPEPPMEPEPFSEPEPVAEPEPVIEPDEVDEEPKDGSAEHLDPHAGWDHPEDTTVHGDPESGLYHTPDSPGYNVGPDGVEFESEDAAQTAGFTRWDQPR